MTCSKLELVAGTYCPITESLLPDMFMLSLRQLCTLHKLGFTVGPSHRVALLTQPRLSENQIITPEKRRGSGRDGIPNDNIQEKKKEQIDDRNPR